MNLRKNDTNNAVITYLDNVRKHPGADRLQLATVLGEQVIVGMDAKEGDKVIYFDSNLRLSDTYLRANNLYANSQLNLDRTKKGYFDNTGRVRAQNFRGEKSYGYVASLDSLLLLVGRDALMLQGGEEFVAIGDVEICARYYAPPVGKGAPGAKRERGDKHARSHMFHEHWDTKKFLREIDGMVAHDRPTLVYIEEKMHGTSHRIANVPVERKLSWIDKALIRLGVPVSKHEWRVIHGTRRVTLTYADKNYRGEEDRGYYSGGMRDAVYHQLAPHVRKNEELYIEIIGYDTNGKGVQPGFPYGCRPGEFKIVLYRVTINAEDGRVYDLGREEVYKRAEELGVLAPPLLDRWPFFPDIIPIDTSLSLLRDNVRLHTDLSESTLDPETMREGVCVWFVTRWGNWACLKNKSFAFLERESKQEAPDVEDLS